MNKIRILIISLTISFINISFAQVDSLEILINQALKVSPKIKMLEMKKLAAENRIEQNSNLPDPMLTFGVVNLPTNSFSLTQEQMTGAIVGLRQDLPFPGKLNSFFIEMLSGLLKAVKIYSTILQKLLGQNMRYQQQVSKIF